MLKRTELLIQPSMLTPILLHHPLKYVSQFCGTKFEYVRKLYETNAQGKLH